jgi:hypothetical protein
MTSSQTAGQYLRSLRDAQGLSRVAVHDKALVDYGIQVGDDTLRLLEDDNRLGISALRLAVIVRVLGANCDEVFDRMFSDQRDGRVGRALAKSVPTVEEAARSGSRRAPKRGKRSGT